MAVTSRTGPANARVWTITATNPSSGIAYNTQINGFQIAQVSGPRCRVSIAPPSAYPVVLGDIASGGSATAAFTLSIDHCSKPDDRGGGDSHDRAHDGNDQPEFAIWVPWSSAVYETGTLVLLHEQP